MALKRIVETVEVKSEPEHVGVTVILLFGMIILLVCFA